jgi:hypothetical protein
VGEVIGKPGPYRAVARAGTKGRSRSRGAAQFFDVSAVRALGFRPSQATSNSNRPSQWEKETLCIEREFDGA